MLSGAAVLSPTLQHDARNLSLGAQGTWVVFESGNEILQGTAAAAWRTASYNGWRAEFSGSLGASKYADSPPSGHALGRARIHLHGTRAGGWVSGMTGGTFGDTDGTPVELSVGLWTIQDRFALVGTANGTWISGASYVDLVGAVRWSESRVQVDAQAGVRPWRSASGSVGAPRRSAYAELAARVSVSERISIAVSGGRYPADPTRGVLAASFVNVGLSLSLLKARVPRTTTISTALRLSARAVVASKHGSEARIEVDRAGNPRVLRVHVEDVTSVELMSDFTDWLPVALTRLSAGTWQARVHASPGVYRLNIRVDGGPWLVPRGTRLEQTEFGGAVGVIVIP